MQSRILHALKRIQACFFQNGKLKSANSVRPANDLPNCSTMSSWSLRRSRSYRPVTIKSTGLGVADIALREIIEEKIGWEMPETVELVRPTAKKKKKR